RRSSVKKRSGGALVRRPSALGEHAPGSAPRRGRPRPERRRQVAGSPGEHFALLSLDVQGFAPGLRRPVGALGADATCRVRCGAHLLSEWNHFRYSLLLQALRSFTFSTVFISRFKVKAARDRRWRKIRCPRA